MRVVSRLSCRNSRPISDKVAPERRSSVARLCRKIWAPWCVAYPMFGRESTRLQPVYVEDVAEEIARCMGQIQTPGMVF